MPGLLAATAAELPTLAGLGYEGEAGLLKKPKDVTLSDHQKAYNALHAGLCSIGERQHPAQEDLQGVTARQPRPEHDQQDRRWSARPAALRAQSHHMNGYA
jgi:hypothetical protein